MTSKYAKTFQCLNGPCGGRYIDASIGAQVGDPCAIPWTKASGAKAFAVYLVVEHEGKEGLMFLRSYDSPGEAQEKVQEMSMVMRALRDQAGENGTPPDGMMDELAPMRPLIFTGQNLS